MKHRRRLKARAMLRRASVVHVEPGDLVVLQLDWKPSYEETQNVRTSLRHMGALAEADVLVVGPGTRLKVIREQQRKGVL